MITRNSQTVCIETPGAKTVLPWVNNEPDFTGITDPTLSVLQNAWEAGKNNIEVIPDPEPIPVVITPDWDELSARVLGGDLFPIFVRLTAAADLSIPISRARGDINMAVGFFKIEAALASGLMQVQANGFVFTEEEKLLWNNALQELGFSAITQIP
jgi:hypothetical protein